MQTSLLYRLLIYHHFYQSHKVLYKSPSRKKRKKSPGEKPLFPIRQKQQLGVHGQIIGPESLVTMVIGGKGWVRTYGPLLESRFQFVSEPRLRSRQLPSVSSPHSGVSYICQMLLFSNVLSHMWSHSTSINLAGLRHSYFNLQVRKLRHILG